MADQPYSGFSGLQQGAPVNDEFFLHDQQAARTRTVMVVKVVAVYPGNPLSANSPTTVDVQPIVNQVASDGTKQDHGTIYGLVVARHHAGGSAVLIDPAVDDVGMIHVADRDISSLAANSGAQSNPGSGRRNDPSDGIYYGGIWTAAASNYIDLRGGQVTVQSAGPIKAVDNKGNAFHANSVNAYVEPAPSAKIYIGAKPGQESSCFAVQTAGGQSSIVFAKV